MIARDAARGVDYDHLAHRRGKISQASVKVDRLVADNKAQTDFISHLGAMRFVNAYKAKPRSVGSGVAVMRFEGKPYAPSASLAAAVIARDAPQTASNAIW